MTTQTLPSIPEPLQSISEVVEMAAFFESGQELLNGQVLEVTMPQLYPNNRSLLLAYIEEVNDNTEYLAEHYRARNNMDVVVATTLRWLEVLTLSAKLGLLPKA